MTVRFPSFRKFFWRRAYEFLAAYHQGCDWTFMNYGYATGGDEKPTLEEADERDRYCIQLYHHVASPADLESRDVLEVSSGRGGGASYLKRYLQPRTVLGLDYSKKAVAFCKRCHAVEGLSFQVGDAEHLPFADSSFDVVINIEASHCYASMSAFLAQVERVLRPGGYFLFADFRNRDVLELLRRQLAGSSLQLIRETDISQNVLTALNRDSQRKTALIQASAGRVLQETLQEFAAVEGSMVFEGFRSGEKVYSSFALRKPGDPSKKRGFRP